MLHGLGADDAAILSRYQGAADSAGLQTYLTALVADIHAQISSIHSQWNGSYLTTFKASLGTDVGSSTSFVVNETNRDLEVIKTASLGIPLGKQTFDTPLPEKVEGLYGELSKPLMQAHLAGLEVMFEGQVAGASDRYGLREALNAVEAEYNGGNLGDAIHAQFQAAKAALAALPEPLSDAVVSNRAPVEAAYTEIQKLVVLMKTDMASALSILITYQDSDGD
jgi:predicted lipoprotein